MLLNRGLARSKVDYYHKHLSLRVLCHSVGDSSEDGIINEDIDVLPPPRSSSPEVMRDEEEEGVEDLERTVYGEFENAPASRFSTKKRTLGRMRDEEAKASSPHSTLSLKHPRRTLVRSNYALCHTLF